MNRLTDEQRAVFARAIDLACYPPIKRARHSSRAQVRWHDIEELRRELEACGIDWRSVRGQHVAARKRAKQAAFASAKPHMGGHV